MSEALIEEGGVVVKAADAPDIVLCADARKLDVCCKSFVDADSDAFSLQILSWSTSLG